MSLELNLTRSGTMENRSEQIASLLKNTYDMALKRRAARLLSGLEVFEGARILDLGCGDGFYLHLLSELGNYDLYGIDPDDRALKSAKRNLADKKIDLRQGKIETLPYEDHFFDRIILSEVLEHLQDDRLGLKDCYRVLKPGGIVIATVPHAHYPFFWDPLNKFLEVFFNFHIRKGFFSGFWFDHKRLYRPEELRSIFEKEKWIVLELVKLTHYCLPFNHYLLNIGARLLQGRKLPQNLARSVSKFEIEGSETKGKRLMDYVRDFLIWVDSFNDRLTQPHSAVGLFIKCKK
ncbi:MAG: class I SAM-dependent methyltransferase [Chlamydiae bacterium]|nr:class I SAM-dependent methyltransferase [Chlamydiota bacterium]MBI3277332.1 class I SAM-dependent methyltransferase [Chlamydiota bacterium]